MFDRIFYKEPSVGVRRVTSDADDRPSLRTEHRTAGTPIPTLDRPGTPTPPETGYQKPRSLRSRCWLANDAESQK